MHPVCKAVIGLSVGLSSVSYAATLEYRFNDPTPLGASGDLGAAAPALAVTAPAVVGAPGSGVSGAATDRALNFTAANAMGGTTNGTGGRVAQAADYDAIDGALRFTVSGWFKTDGTAPLGGNAVLVSNRSGIAGFSVIGDPNVPGNLILNVDNGSNSSAGFGAVGQYVNFAVTYDGTILQPGPNVFFYAGGINQPLTLVGSGTNTNGSGNDPADNDTAALSFGARNLFGTLNGDSFDGLIDEVRITDSVVPLATLEAQRIAAIPEPAALALVGLGGVLAMRRRRHA